MSRVILNLQTVDFSEEQFFRLCQVNQLWRFEKNAQGELLLN